MSSLLQIRQFLTALVVLGACFTGSTAEAKQCIFNKGGYVLIVKWFMPAALRGGQSPQGPVVKPIGEPSQVDTLTAGFGACTKTDDVMTAAVSIAGCVAVKFADTKQDFPCRPWMQGEARMSNGTLSCSRCGITVDDDPLAPGGRFTPAGAELVLVTSPSSSTYIDFWGSTMNAQWGPGGPIN